MFTGAMTRKFDGIIDGMGWDYSHQRSGAEYVSAFFVVTVKRCTYGYSKYQHLNQMQLDRTEQGTWHTPKFLRN